MNTMSKTTSDTSNCGNDLQSINNYGIFHEEIIGLNECLQKMNIVRETYANCYAEVCKLSLQKKQTEEDVAEEDVAEEDVAWKAVANEGGGDDSGLRKGLIDNLRRVTTQLQSYHRTVSEMQKNDMSLGQMMPYRGVFHALKPLIDMSNKISSELQKKQIEKAVAMEADVIKNLRCMETQLQSCRYTVREMKESGNSLKQMMSQQEIEQCRNWLFNTLYQKMFHELNSLVNIFKEISKENLLQKQSVQHVMQWMNVTREHTMKVVEFLDGTDNVPHNHPTCEEHLKKLEQANIDIIRKYGEIMAEKKPNNWDSTMLDSSGNIYPFAEHLKSHKNIEGHRFLTNVKKELQTWLDSCRFIRTKHDILSDPKEITNLEVQLHNELDQLVLTMTQIMPPEMKFSSDYLTNAFQEQIKDRDSVCLANAFREQVKIREQQDRTENSVENQVKDESVLEKSLNKIFELEKQIITSIASPVLTSFVDCRRSIDLIEKKTNDVKDTCKNAMRFIQSIVNSSVALFSSHLTTTQKETYEKLCSELPCNLDIIKNEYRKLCYFLKDKKNKGQEMLTENMEEMIKDWMEKSSTFDIADHIYMLQGQLTCINEEASTKNTSLKKNTMGDLLQEISYYEMKADHLMVDYIKIYQENRGQFQSQ